MRGNEYRRARFAEQVEAHADWTGSGGQQFSRGLIDDRHPVGERDFLIGQRPAGAERDSQRCEDSRR